MAFVILSAKALTQSKIRAVDGRALMLGVSAAILLTLAGGVWLGYRLAQPPEAASVVAEAPEPEPVVAVAEPEGRFVIDRLGELSGRLFRLESEAEALAKRIGVIKAFENRLKTPVPGDEAAPLGGPMIPPVGERLSLGEGLDLSAPGSALEALEGQLIELDEMFASIDAAASRRKLSHMLFPSRAPVKAGRRSSSFGNRYDPFTSRRAFHSGLDFAAPRGTPIHAAAGGKVTSAGWHREYGNKIEIDHGNGLVTRYAHATKLYVKEGEVVVPGQRIATVGSTGRSTGPHLHFEILENGKFVDPALYLAGN